MSPAKTTYDVKGNVTLEKKAENGIASSGDENVAKSSKKSGYRHKHAKPAKDDSSSSSDSDTDECYEPFSMEAWRWATVFLDVPVPWWKQGEMSARASLIPYMSNINLHQLTDTL